MQRHMACCTDFGRIPSDISVSLHEKILKPKRTIRRAVRKKGRRGARLKILLISPEMTMGTFKESISASGVTKKALFCSVYVYMLDCVCALYRFMFFSSLNVGWCRLRWALCSSYMCVWIMLYNEFEPLQTVRQPCVLMFSL